ncbi:proton-coupled folate transporter-like [Adelges cooleyi]|uniref:proton-coupled folate transporter-like n=1 Tax=Adelges cooleyi TaxID=133065 RepID=UPI002180869C|nr:proton-coupled folate transporter-like [Adelges cooleyi]XP_050422970.1 proton-coupled folate transporter-like [Adelges cooleyi]
MDPNKEINDKNTTSINDEDDDEWQKMGFGSKTKYVFKNITVEPLMALFQVSSVLSSLTTQNLNLSKACRVNLQLSDDVCYGLENKNMSSYPREEEEVQHMVADMLIWQTIIQSSIPCVLVIFIGSWSDRHQKRKPCMIIPILGELVRNIGLLLCVYYYYQLPLEVAGLVESIPSAIAGGMTVLYLAAFSYVGDVSTMKNRTLRVGLMNLFFGAAWPIGAALSGILFQQLGFYGVYYISTALYLISLIYGIFRIKENPKRKTETEPVQILTGCTDHISDFFNINHISEAFKVTFKREPHIRWLKIMMLMFVIVVVQGPMQGETAVGYLYTRIKFNWNEVDYSVFSTFSFMANIAGVGIALGIFSQLFKMDDSLIGIIAVTSKVVSGFVYAFASTELMFYIGSLTEMMAGSSYIVVRSILSKVVPQNELGQVSAIIAVIETLVPVVYKPLYSAIYNTTLNVFPGTFYIVGAIMLIPAIIIYIWMYLVNRKSQRETQAIERINNGYKHDD